MVTLITKLYKKDGKVHYETGTRFCTIEKDKSTGLKYYPITHMNWKIRKGSSRGEGVVRHLIANQIEVNRTLMRRAIVVKNTAYTQRIVDIDHIQNPEALDKVGTIIKVSGQTVDDVRKIFNIVNPAQMSTDVEKLQNDLIQITRDLQGAGDIATGSVNPTEASGKAILAVQRASEMPLTEQVTYLKSSLEDLARIYFDMIVTYSGKTITLEEEKYDEQTEETYIVPVEYPTYILEQLRLTVKIDITPKSPLDRFAQEESIENLLQAGFFNPERLNELKVYAKLLDDDSVMNKQKLLEAIKEIEINQQKIAEIEARNQQKLNKAQQFIDSDPEAQAEEILKGKIRDQIMQKIQTN